MLFVDLWQSPILVFTNYETCLWKEVYGKLILQECIDEIESYQIPVGNSPAGELACEWTYDALKDIRQNIKEKFLIK